MLKKLGVGRSPIRLDMESKLLIN
uniref:Uncharacterized protein n=1 Tax=Rhizophora mucronata TaxID=61149 RepID=A0A2P2NAN7_RHIMU